MHLDIDVLYCGIANQPSPVYSSMYLSNFLPFHTLIMKFIVKDFYGLVQARVDILGIQVDDDMLYSSMYLFNFHSFHTLIMKFIVKDFYRTVQARVVILGIQVDDDMLYRGIANHPSPAYSSLYFSNFLSFHSLNNEFFRRRFL